jgi:hypothetical protein
VIGLSKTRLLCMRLGVGTPDASLSVVQPGGSSEAVCSELLRIDWNRRVSSESLFVKRWS